MIWRIGRVVNLFIPGVLSVAAMSSYPIAKPNTIRLFFCGDVMLGRGVDQILRYKVDPKLFEDYVKDARGYVKLVVEENGPLPENRPVDYVWGDAIRVLEGMKPDVRIINLETAVTAEGKPWPHKGINYRMHPGNVEVIESAKIDCCILSNNHVLDWDYSGLTDTLNSLQKAGIKTVGAGENDTQAHQPAIFPIPNSNSRLLVFGIGSPTSGVPASWRATPSKAGVFYVDSFSTKQAKEVMKVVNEYKKPGDLIILSIHWGSNWGWDLDPGSLDFAKYLIDQGINVIYGHSSHHIRPVEVYKNRLIATGCGDFISDYEGITGNSYHDGFRDDLSLMYFADLNVETGDLVDLYLVPMRLKHISLHRATGNDQKWLLDKMKEQCRRFGKDIEQIEGNIFKLIPKQ